MMFGLSRRHMIAAAGLLFLGGLQVAAAPPTVAEPSGSAQGQASAESVADIPPGDIDLVCPITINLFFDPAIGYRPQRNSFDGSYATEAGCASPDGRYSTVATGRSDSNPGADGVNSCLEASANGAGVSVWKDSTGTVVGSNAFDWHFAGSANGVFFQGGVPTTDTFLAGDRYLVEVHTLQQQPFTGGCFVGSAITSDTFTGTLVVFADPGTPRIEVAPGPCTITVGPFAGTQVASWTDTINGFHFTAGTVSVRDAGAVHTVWVDPTTNDPKIVQLATGSPVSGSATAAGDGTFTTTIAQHVLIGTQPSGTPITNTDDVDASDAGGQSAVTGGGPNICYAP